MSGSVGYGAPVYTGEAAPATPVARQRASPGKFPAPAAAGPVAPEASPALAPAPEPTMTAGPQTADQFSQELHGRTEQYTKQLAELHRDDTPQPKFEQADPLKGFASLGGLIGVFGSLLSKQPLVSALNASSSAMEALKQGKVEEYATKVKEWSMHRDYVMQVEGNISKQYNAILADKKLSYQEKVAEQRAILAQTNANAHLAMAGGSHQLAVDRFYEQIADRDRRHAEHGATEALGIFKTGVGKLENAAAVAALGELGKLQAAGMPVTISAVTDILQGKPVKLTAGAGSAQLSEFATAANTMKPESPPLELAGQKYTYRDIQEVKKATDPTMLKTPLRNAWDAIHKGTLAPQPRPAALPVAKADGGAKAFPSMEAAMAAIKSGQLKENDEVSVDGKVFTVGPQ